MSADLETRLQEAFAARADTTTTAPDAWARVNRGVARRDHRRSVVLRSVAAAAIVVLVVGGGVALFRDGDRSGTVATGGDASKTADSGASSRASSGAGGGSEAAPFSPAADGLEVQTNADGTIVVRLGSTTTAPVQPGGISAAIDGEKVFGVVPSGVGAVRISADTAPGVAKVSLADLAPSTDEPRTFVVSGFGDAIGPIKVEAGGATTFATNTGGGR